MHLKTYYKSALYTLCAVAAAAFAACDEVSDDNRFIELPAIESQRVVLIEEFTGQKCVNCPDAHEIIAQLQQQYGEDLISVSLHGGGDAFSYTETALPGYGLANDDSQAYCDMYGIKSLPMGVVNRVSGPQDRDQWAKYVREQLEKPSYLDLEVSADYAADKIDIAVTLSAHDNLKGNLLVWIVEDGIVSLQLTPNGFVTDYVHNNVFRATVNGLQGTPYTLYPQTDEEYTASVAVGSNWKVENLSVVAFVYNGDGVLQAAKTKVSE